MHVISRFLPVNTSFFSVCLECKYHFLPSPVSNWSSLLALPMALSDAQYTAILEARHLLQNTGLSLDANVVGIENAALFSGTLLPSGPVQGYQYLPCPARPFTNREVAQGVNKVNRQTSLDGIVDHPLGVIVEYPETGSVTGIRIGHRFAVDPLARKISHPKLNIQFSLGDGHGSRQDVDCGILLTDTQTQKPAICKNEKISCECLLPKSLKYRN